MAFVVDYPWQETWWQLYLLFVFLVMPLTLWALTYSCQRTEVTIVNPLAALSTLSTLLVASTIFAKTFLPSHILGIIIVTTGLLCLYQGRWHAWRKPWPWIVLVSVLILGVNVAIIKEVLERFPHPLAVLALAATVIFVMNAIAAGKKWSRFPMEGSALLLLSFFAIASLSQDIFTFLALNLGPAPHVVAVKRTSIFFAAIGGYFIFKERDQSLVRLLISCVVVVGGVVLLNV